MKIETTIESIILAIIRLIFNQSYYSITYIILGLISSANLISIYYQKPSNFFQIICVCDLVLTIAFCQTTPILELFILAQEIEKYKCLIVVVGLNVRFIQTYSLEEIIASEAISLVLIILNYWPKQVEIKKPRNSQYQIDEHSSIITQSLNFQKDLFKNILNLIPNGILILHDQNTINISNQQIAHIFPNMDDINILKILKQAINCKQEFQFNQIHQLNETLKIPFNYSEVANVGLEIEQLFTNKDFVNVQFSLINTTHMYAKLINQNVYHSQSRYSKTSLNSIPEDFYSIYLDLIFIGFVEESQFKLMIFIKDISTYNKVSLLRKMNRNKSKLLRNVCHEIRNPLSAISLITEAMKQDSSELYHKYGQDIHIAITILLNLLNDLLDVAQISSGKFSLAIKPFNLNNMLNEISHLFSYKLIKKNVELQIISKLDYINSDENRIRQVLINLISNSLKFTEYGQITIKIERLYYNSVQFQIIDTGIGIRMEEQMKLFKTFGKLENNQSLNPNGIGLGLHISQVLCRKLSNSLQGLQVQSEGEGKGSTFTFIVQDHSIDTMIRETKASNEHWELDILDCECLEILIVDDCEFNLQAAQSVFKKYLYKIDTASSGIEAYEKIMTYQSFNDCICKNYRIVLLDLEMPFMDGFKTAELILQDFPKDMIQIFGCSGLEGYDIEQKCLGVGMSGLISKPITYEKLGQILKEDGVWRRSRKN